MFERSQADDTDSIEGFSTVSGIDDRLGDGPDPILETLEAEGFAYELVRHTTGQPGYYFTNAAVQESSPLDAVGVT